MECKCQSRYTLCFLLGCFVRLPAEFSSAVDYLSLKFATCVVPLTLTVRLLMSYIYGAPSKARNANVVYIWTYVWQR